MVERNTPEEENEVVLRCRKVRQELFARFKTPDELFAWLRGREEQGGHKLWYRGAKAQVRKIAKLHARSGKPANNKPAHKA
ncbi:MAG TPA: hypothetical protein VGP72_04785 [Planctomycetota bacterium]|jgi:hypothetical protein